MRHELDRLGPDGFEKLIQALMSKQFGIRVKIYGDGPDRQREALIEDAHYTLCDGVETLGKTIVQAKYKSPEGSQNDWNWLRGNIKKELDGFSKKKKTESDFVPKTWLFFTNLVLTPGEGGLKDKADEFAAQYKGIIPNIYILGTDEIRSLLDAHPDVARRYAAFLVPGDVLADAITYLEKLRLKPLQNLMEYIRQRFMADAPVRLEQAGGTDCRIEICHVYTDMEARIRGRGDMKFEGLAAAILRLGDRPHPHSSGNSGVSDFSIRESNLVLIGSAGQGKSTLCQYICQLYRAALLERYCPEIMDAHDYSEETGISKPRCERFPLLIRLKDYAAWLGQLSTETNGSVLQYLVQVIERESNAGISVPDFRTLLKSYSWIFIFDGLDEVPASSNRVELLEQINCFLKEITEVNCDCLIICTTRPQGYDNAFSSNRFRHLELQDMSHELCLRYVDRLLMYLESDSQYRYKYYNTLQKSLNDPLVAKLMTTPLYAAILVLLVKSGSTPPTRRFELFEEYCETVIRRERQKELLPCLYDGDYVWITELHGQFAYLLQSESETVKNAAAELALPRCRELIYNYLEEEKWQGDRNSKVEELLRAMTERLPFLAETTGANEESVVLFPLRSLQEYYAARFLLRIDNEEKRLAMLQAISMSAYWRNVFLFTAGCYSKDDRRSVNNDIYNICLCNNGNDGFECREPKACQLAMSGSRLALDLLCDNLFERRNGQERYLNLVTELLAWDGTDDSMVNGILKLPPALLDKFVRNKAIPRLLEEKKTDEASFTFLWEMAKNGNCDALDCLEQLADKLYAPSPETFYALFSRGTDRLGQKILRRSLSWMEKGYLLSLSYDSFSLLRFIENVCVSEGWEKLPADVTRWLTYKMLSEFHFEYKHDIGFMKEAIDKVKTNMFLSEVSRAGYEARNVSLIRGNDLSFFPCFCESNADIWKLCESSAREQGFAELSALFAFFRMPSPTTLSLLLESEKCLPRELRRAFRRVIRSQNWLLKDIAELLEEGEETKTLLQIYDAAEFQRCQERESKIAKAVQTGDYAVLTAINAWKDLYEINFGPDRVNFYGILDAIGKGRTLNDFIVYYVTGLSPDSRKALLHCFPGLSQFWCGQIMMLLAFSETPVSNLADNKLLYPSVLPVEFYNLNSEDKIDYHEVVDRINKLSALGGEYVESYALLPFIFLYAETKDLCCMVKDEERTYDSVRATENECALLGVILALLTKDEIPQELADKLQNDLECLMKKETNPEYWYSLSRHFSLRGELLVYKTGTNAFRGTEQMQRFYILSRRAILQSLSELPAERDKMPPVSTLAY